MRPRPPSYRPAYSSASRIREHGAKDLVRVDHRLQLGLQGVGGSHRCERMGSGCLWNAKWLAAGPPSSGCSPVGGSRRPVRQTSDPGVHTSVLPGNPATTSARPLGPRPKAIAASKAARMHARPETPVVVLMGVIISAKDARKYSHPVSVGNGFGETKCQDGGAKRQQSPRDEAQPRPRRRSGSEIQDHLGDHGLAEAVEAEGARNVPSPGLGEMLKSVPLTGRRDRRLPEEACVVEPVLEGPGDDVAEFAHRVAHGLPVHGGNLHLVEARA